MQTKTQMLDRWYTDVWQDGNLDAIDIYFAPETDAQGIVPDLSMGPTEFRDLVTVIREMVDRIEITVIHAVEQGNWLSALVQFRAHRKSSDVLVHGFSQVMVRFDGDKMVETYNSFDFLTFFEQLGQMPPDSLPLLLTGTHLTEAG